jgi:hypothetical protein
MPFEGEIAQAREIGFYHPGEKNRSSPLRPEANCAPIRPFSVWDALQLVSHGCAERQSNLRSRHKPFHACYSAIFRL